eukprot:COSAG05_NODE_14820_length_386_cov_0.714286_1_plen_52_part_10
MKRKTLTFLSGVDYSAASEARIVAALLTLMDGVGLDSSGARIVVGAKVPSAG